MIPQKIVCWDIECIIMKKEGNGFSCFLQEARVYKDIIKSV